MIIQLIPYARQKCTGTLVGLFRGGSHPGGLSLAMPLSDCPVFVVFQAQNQPCAQKEEQRKGADGPVAVPGDDQEGGEGVEEGQEFG